MNELTPTVFIPGQGWVVRGNVGPPPNIEDPVPANSYNKMVIRASAGLPPAMHLPGPVRQAAVQNNSLANETRAALEAIREAMRAAIAAMAQASIQHAQVQQARYRQEAPRQYARSAQTGKPSQIRAMVNRSVGLPPTEPVSPAAELPVSPATGKPSALTAMIRRSVGITE